MNKPTFESFQFAAPILEALASQRLQHPTEIQQLALPLLLKGQDAKLISETGSGKTFAYLLPVLSQLYANSESRALILVPSREVAEQIYRVFMKFTAQAKLSQCLVIAGLPNKDQVRELKKMPRVIVATPGRLNEHLQNNKLLLQKVAHLIIDEADRMLDLGFGPQLIAVRKTMRGEFQTVLCSASYGAALDKISKQFLRTEALEIRSSMAEMPTASLQQKVFHIARGMKNDRLVVELQNLKGSVLVFCSTQESCEFVGKHLKANGFSMDLIHGGLIPGHRNRVIRDFLAEKFQILITTDLLARGIDVDHINCVVNYDLPKEPEDFLHRIGRTARAGRPGLAITFVTEYDKEKLPHLLKYLTGAKEETI